MAANMLTDPNTGADPQADPAAQRARMSAWLDELQEADPVCARAVEDRLDLLLARAPAESIGRWILAGLRLHDGDRQRLRAYLSLSDEAAVQSLHREIAAGGVERAAPSLGLLVQGFTARAVAVQPRAQGQLYGAPLRPTLTPTHLLLPDDYTALDGGDRYQLFRTAAAHAAAHLLHSAPGLPAGKLKPMSLAVISAIEDARVERLMLRSYPGMRRWFVDALAHALQPAGLGFAALVSRLNLALMDPAYQDDNHWVNKARGMFEAQAAIGLGDYAAFRRLGSLLANDLGQMRVPFRAELYRVPAAYRDDNAFLWTYDDARAQAQPLELHVPQSSPNEPPDAASGDALPSPDAPGMREAELARTTHAEWDHRVAVLRSDWCTVIDKLPSWAVARSGIGRGASGTAARETLRLVRARRLSRVHRLRRQWEGDDLDLNAAVEVMVAHRARLPIDPRLFIRSASEERACSLLVLLDLSESTTAPLDGTGACLLDLEKEAALLLARAVTAETGSGPTDRIAIHGFSSNTRAQVDYYRLLEFGAPLDARAEAMISAAPGRHSTRMGAALRHAARTLSREPSQHRVVLLVTDGAPSDIDVHDPVHLVEDARAAVHEARAAGFQVHCLAVDAAADAYVRRIFGWGHFDIVDDPHALPATLCRLYARLSCA